MKTLMLSTALVTATAVGAMAQGSPDTMPAAVPAFLSSDFAGMTLYALDSEDVRILRDGTGRTAADADRQRWTSSETFAAQRDAWTHIGAIDDIVMTQDGEVQGVLVDVGGFLGLGARTVMVDFEAIYFVSGNVTPMMGDGQVSQAPPDEIGDFQAVIAMSQEELEALPAWDAAQLSAGFAQHGNTVNAAPQTDAAQAPADAMAPMARDGGDAAVFSDGYEPVSANDLTAERLIGADVFDANGENIGSVDDTVLGGGDAVGGIIVDVGGFRGIGAHSVNLPIDDARIVASAEDDSIRVQISLTGDTLEAMPEYEG